MILEEFNYLFNKAINLYINKSYNVYDVNLQYTDNLRVLKATAVLTPKLSDLYGDTHKGVNARNSLYNATYEVLLPPDYLHILNCICNFEVKKQFKCYDKDTYVLFPATRLTADAWSLVMLNFYMKPSYKRPYYYLHNTNTYSENVQSPRISTNPYEYDEEFGTYRGTDVGLKTTLTALFEQYKSLNADKFTFDLVTTSQGIKTWVATDKNNATEYFVIYDASNKRFILAESAQVEISITNGVVNVYTPLESVYVGDTTLYINTTGATLGDLNQQYNLVSEDFLDNYGNAVVLTDAPREIQLGNGEYLSTVEKTAGYRYGNLSNVRCEIRYGKDNSVFALTDVYIDYIKAPQFIRLTQEQLDLTEDTSLMMEFPDYVCQEIINELVHLVMENASDQRLQTHPVVTLSIANPAQQLTQST